MEMEFSSKAFRQNPEQQVANAETRDRDLIALEKTAEGYARQAQGIMSGPDGSAAHDEVARFAQQIISTDGPEREEQLDRLVKALNLRRRSIFDVVPDEKRERQAFALALVYAHEKSLQ